MVSAIVDLPMHPEDIKAALRKEYGSVFAFEDANDLPRKSVSDFLRGRTNRRVRDAIFKTVVTPTADLSDCNNNAASMHRLCAGAK